MVKQIIKKPLKTPFF